MQAFNDSFHIHRGNGYAALFTSCRRVGGNGGTFPLILNLALDVVTGQRHVPATLAR